MSIATKRRDGGLMPPEAKRLSAILRMEDKPGPRRSPEW